MELDLERFRAKRIPGEVEAPEEAPAGFVANADALAQLMGMGFGKNACERALLNTGNSDAESAMNWVFAHMEDANFNEELTAEEKGLGGGGGDKMDVDDGGVDEDVVASLVANLGMFTAEQVRPVLKHVGGAQDRAADWLFSHMDSLDADVAALSAGGGGGEAPTSLTRLTSRCAATARACTTSSASYPTSVPTPDPATTSRTSSRMESGSSSTTTRWQRASTRRWARGTFTCSRGGRARLRVGDGSESGRRVE